MGCWHVLCILRRSPCNPLSGHTVQGSGAWGTCCQACLSPSQNGTCREAEILTAFKTGCRYKQEEKAKGNESECMTRVSRLQVSEAEALLEPIPDPFTPRPHKLSGVPINTNKQHNVHVLTFGGRALKRTHSGKR